MQSSWVSLCGTQMRYQEGSAQVAGTGRTQAWGAVEDHSLLTSHAFFLSMWTQPTAWHSKFKLSFVESSGIPFPIQFGPLVD